MAQRFVRLLFNFTCSFVSMISVYYDVNLFKLFLRVRTYFCLPIGGETQSHQDVGGLQHIGDIRRKWGDLKTRGHHENGAFSFLRPSSLKSEDIVSFLV